MRIGILIMMSFLLGACGPMINDVSSNLENPPEFRVIPKKRGKSVKSYSFPLKNVELQKKIHPNLKPCIVERSSDELFDALLGALKSATRTTIVESSATELRAEATCVSRFFRFRDDLVVELRPLEGGKIEVAARSKSRLGRDDFGVNAARIESLFKTLRCIKEAPQ